MKAIIATISIILLTFAPLIAQENLYNPNSTKQVRRDDIMFKKSLWFRVDMRTKFNSAYFAKGHEISRILINGVKNGTIQPFHSDSLDREMSKEEFLKRLKIPELGPENDMLEMNGDTWDNNSWSETSAEKKAKEKGKASENDEYFPEQLYLMELKEDMIFDQRESRMKHDLLAITLVIPAELSPTGLEKELCTFSYKQLKEYFKTDPNAVWYNANNPAKHLSLSHAFDLGLFRGRLVKYENPQNALMMDMYEGKTSLLKGEQVLHKLMEYEYNLWSY